MTAINKRGVLLTVSNIMSFMASYLGGQAPSVSDEEYMEWLRWIQLGQQDAANRGFWRRLLTPATLSITANAETTDLPDNFFKVNGIYTFVVDGVDWSRPNNEDEMKLFVEMNPTTAVWRVRYLPTAPTTSEPATLWYFFNPPIPQADTDIVFLDGEMIAFYAIKEYFRKLKQFGSMDDARLEYENRFRELLNLEVLPSPQELISWSSYYEHKNIDANEKAFYSGRNR